MHDHARFAAIVEPAMRQEMARYGVPGLLVVAQVAEGPVYQIAIGTDATGQPITENSLFPVASITKLATALAVLRLVGDRRIALDAPLASYLPNAASSQPGVTIRRLLSHSAGLPLDLPQNLVPSASTRRWSTYAQACRETPLQWPPYSRVQYSNVGYGLLALVVQQLTGTEAQEAVARTVLEPLGIEGYLGTEPSRPTVKISDIRGSEAGTPFEPFNSNLWLSLGLPWAGLVTTGRGTLELARGYGASSAFLPGYLAREATSNQDDDLPGGFVPPLVWPTCWWGLGPDLRDEKSPHWTPPEASPDTFGHSGASGCCVWDDPTRNLRWAILGARSADNGWLIRAGSKIATTVIGALIPPT